MTTIEQLQAQINELKENAEFTGEHIENLQSIISWLMSQLSKADETFLTTLQTFLTSQTKQYEKTHGPLHGDQYEFFNDFSREVAEQLQP